MLGTSAFLTMFAIWVFIMVDGTKTAINEHCTQYLATSSDPSVTLHLWCLYRTEYGFWEIAGNEPLKQELINRYVTEKSTAP